MISLCWPQPCDCLFWQVRINDADALMTKGNTLNMGISRFDKRVSFTATEIACLINGLDPANIASDRPSRSDYEVLRLASENALNHAIDESCDDSVVIVKQDKCLYSTLLEKWLNPERSESETSFLSNSHQIRYVMIYQQKKFPKFDELFFSRKEVIRFLSELGYVSVYAFDGNKNMNNLKPISAEKPVKEPQLSGFLNIIGAMLELLKSPREGRNSNEAVIQELVKNYSDKYGISKSNLEAKFAEARRSLNAN